MKYKRLFKKFESEMIRTIPWNVSHENIDVWFQDEARFGQQNTTTKLWTEKGTRPRAVRQQQFEYAYLFGAVCPSTGADSTYFSSYEYGGNGATLSLNFSKNCIRAT
ncbi:hypothetical protein CJF42_05835, partial [Pseudoalteromonas sp. NBT06-2]